MNQCHCFARTKNIHNRLAREKIKQRKLRQVINNMFNYFLNLTEYYSRHEMFNSQVTIDCNLVLKLIKFWHLFWLFLNVRQHHLSVNHSLQIIIDGSGWGYLIPESSRADIVPLTLVEMLLFQPRVIRC